MNNDRNDEFQAREAAIPGQMSALISSFMNDVSDGEYKNRMRYAQFCQAIVAIENVHWGVEMGVLTLEQALTLMADIPFMSFIDMTYFGTDNANLEMEFRVSASRSSNNKLEVGVHSKTEAKTGGLFGLLGGGGSFSLSADTTYTKENRRQSDYSSTVKCDVHMKRFEPPETVSFMSNATEEMVKGGIEINKKIIEQQKAQLDQQANSADIPQQLPKSDEDATGGDSGSGQPSETPTEGEGN